jgi:hypothetical protein
MLRDLEGEQFGDLLSGLADATDAITPADLRKAAAKSGLDEEARDAIMEAVLGVAILALANDWPTQETAKAIAHSRGWSSPKGREDAPPEGQERLAERLAACIEAPCVQRAAKAADLLLADERTFQAARIVTEFRPVFPLEGTASVTQGLLRHTLIVEYHDSTSSNTLHLALTEDDVAELKRVLDRADEKAVSLSKALSMAGMRVVNFDA